MSLSRFRAEPVLTLLRIWTSRRQGSSRGAVTATLSDVAVRELRQLQIVVTNLPAGTLGATAGHIVWIDQDANGSGWITDDGTALGAANANALFGNPSDENAFDLDATLAHEFGHVLGLQHDEELFSASLSPGLHPEVLANVIDDLFARGMLDVP